MTEEFGSHLPSYGSFWPSAFGLSAKLREYGCPMEDDTPWRQSESGERFTSPDEIGIAASWLPCVSPGGRAPDPGTCVDCELWEAGLIPLEPSQ